MGSLIAPATGLVVLADNNHSGVAATSLELSVHPFEECRPIVIYTNATADSETRATLTRKWLSVIEARKCT